MIGKRIALGCLGVLAALVIFEGVLRVARGKPVLPFDSDTELFESFFRLDRDGRTYVTSLARTMAKPSSFPAVRSAKEKLVFIVGESVAWLNDDEGLKADFEKVFPGLRWHIVNAGIQNYDAYKIQLIVQDIVRYRPDLVILMMGNNDARPRPRRIAVSLLRNRVLSRFWVPQIVTRVVFPDIVVPAAEYAGDFRENFQAILSLLNAHQVPVVVCVLPQNCKYPDYERFLAEDRFPAWWLLHRNPERAARNPAAGRWIKAAACELLGNQAVADEYYLARPYPKQGIIRETVQRFPSIVVVDFARRLEREMRGYNLFTDSCHYWRPLYRLLAADIVGSVAGRPGFMGLTADTEGLRRAASRPAMNEIRADIRRYMADSYFDLLSDFELVRIVGMGSKYLNMLECARYVWRVDPQTVLSGLRSLETRPVYNPGMFVLFGEMFREEGRYRQAFECFDRARPRDADNFLLYLFRGLCYYDTGDTKRADDDFRVLGRLDPGMRWLNSGRLRRIEQESL